MIRGRSLISLYEATLDLDSACSWHSGDKCLSQAGKSSSNFLISLGPPTPAPTKQVWEV